MSTSKVVHSVPMSVTKFTETDLEISLKYVNPDVWPGFYDNQILSEKFPGLTYVDRRIIPIKDIIMDINPDEEKENTHRNALLAFSIENVLQQEVRTGGLGQNYQDVWSDMENFGFKLSSRPVAVGFCPDKKIHIIDARTRLLKLKQAGFKNVIVDYYECKNYQSLKDFAQYSNMRRDPSSPHTPNDIVLSGINKIRLGQLKPDVVSIRFYVELVAPESFTKGVIDKIVARIHQNVIPKTSVTFTTKFAVDTLRTIGYHDNENNNGIFYYVVSTESPGSVIANAAQELLDLQNKNKKVRELRIVLQTGTLEAADPEASWKSKIDTFRNRFKDNFNNIKEAYFRDYETKNIIKLYGALPAVNSLASEYPMDRLVIFSVGKLKDKTFAEIDMENGLTKVLMGDEEEMEV